MAVVERGDAAVHNIDLAQARRFLRIIDPPAEAFTFQTFGESEEGKDDGTLSRIRHGQLSKHAVDITGELIGLNKKGAGVFVAMNETDGEGRAGDNITRVRAVCLDLDGAPLPTEWPLKPHVIVESSRGRYHVYWRVRLFPMEDFAGVQRGIAKLFNGDAAIDKLTHCARLPGFHHRKAEPFLTHIVEANDIEPYLPEVIKGAFPPEDRPHAPPKSQRGRLVLAEGAPKEWAEEFVKENYVHNGISTLVYCRSNWYTFTGSHFEEVAQIRIERELYVFLDKAMVQKAKAVTPFNPTPNKVYQTAEVLKRYLLEDSKWNPPFDRLPNGTRVELPNVIVLRNGVLDIETRLLSPAHPSLFAVNCLPFDYDPKAAKPKQWYRFLKQLWPGIKGTSGWRARLSLQEIFGLMLTTDTRYHKIFMIKSRPRGGKDTIAKVLTGLVGKANVATPTMSGLTSDPTLAAMIDKQVAIIGDARTAPRGSGHTLVERLLSISGGSGLTINRKYKDAWSGRLGVRFLILTNELPHLPDASQAIAKRFVLLTHQKSWLGKEDLDLLDRLLSELPGIFNWALRGLDRLRKRGRFKMPKTSLRELRMLELLSSPVTAFAEDWCAFDPGAQVDCKELYAAFCHWCEANGHPHTSNIAFGRALSTACAPHVTRRGNAQKSYYGIRLNSVGEEQCEMFERANRRY